MYLFPPLLDVLLHLDVEQEQTDYQYGYYDRRRDDRTISRDQSGVVHNMLTGKETEGEPLLRILHGDRSKQ